MQYMVFSQIIRGGKQNEKINPKTSKNEKKNTKQVGQINNSYKFKCTIKQSKWTKCCS